MNVLRVDSLRGRLLLFLLGAIVLAAVVQAALAYRNALREADGIFDHHMQQIALALRAGQPVGPVMAPAGVNPDDERFDFVVQVWNADGLRVFQSSARDLLPQLAVLGFSNERANGTTYRVFSVQSPSQVIQVAQDMAARRAMATALALRTVAPIALMAPLLMLVVWWVVSGSLAPVARVRRQVATRRADDLTALSEGGVPAEIRPLVQELNLLFGRVRQAFDAQSRFVADAAHELRSPLAALKLQVQGLERAPDEATRALAVRRLHAGVERASRLVEQLLVLARQQARVADAPPLQPVPLAALARQVVGELSMQAQARGIDLGIAHADEVQVDGHAEALAILLRNLLDNALKFTPSGGRADVEVQRTDSGVLLAVDDSGPGIAEADRARVLQRFARVAGSDVPGSGLGLAIVQSIAELHHATLTLTQSPRLGGLRASVLLREATAAH